MNNPDFIFSKNVGDKVLKRETDRISFQLIYYSRIILFAFLIATIAATSEFTVRCLVTYLRAEDVNEELFANVESVGNYTECADMVSTFFDAFYNRFNSSQRFYDCVKMIINGSSWKNAYILIEALERLDLGWKKWKIPEKNKRILELTKALHSGLKAVQDACHESAAKEDLAAEFDRIVKAKKSFPEDQEYCVQKHLVHVGILNSNAYNSTLRSKSINHDADTCNLVISTMQGDYYRELQKHISDCIVNFYRRNHFQEHYLKVEYVLAPAELNEYLISFARDSFVKSVFTIMKNAREACGVLD